MTDAAHANPVATIRADARIVADMTAAEFDHSLATGDGQALAAMNEASYRLANATYPAVQPGDGEEVLRQRTERAQALWQQVWPEIEAMVTRAKAMEFSGWSSASSGPIRYAR
ncbi:hypothetical protein BBK82_03455 [Lentzea guizhouensis]|uniref:Uncharacterized protein n=1 Tax=Lentzea guizhouensis TaxID=1586287 RepID=A0A1B2HC41_9PSEU|nr:hypothetical protein [Lentzea guizhouensis]ANZ35272.1 hypothetical protein BBK82_03455 [Lentzea guizhouensis]